MIEERFTIQRLDLAKCDRDAALMKIVEKANSMGLDGIKFTALKRTDRMIDTLYILYGERVGINGTPDEAVRQQIRQQIKEWNDIRFKKNPIPEPKSYEEILCVKLKDKGDDYDR